MVVYAPQLAAAKATVVAAKAAVTEAELNLARTRITAPFACRVRSEEVEVGQVVRPGTPVAQVAGTDRAEVIVPLGDEQAAALAIPRADGGKEGHGSPATVR
ncbi:MAG TPA: efflux RND transporter periplasmic adaptor subunit, partial [Proteobacteria bacterium]|nr:efflux RND transporter periplasmic adaptor subunit [Pseudomonadota bacterium]